MGFSRYVQCGRVCLVSDGDHKGNLVSIVDVIDQTRVLVDGPVTGVPRKGIRINQLQLTKLKMKHPYTAGTRTVRKAWEDNEILTKWSESKWAKKLANKEQRARMGDFDRFKLRQARSLRNRVRTEAFKVLRKRAAKSGVLYGKKSIPKKKKTPRVKKPADPKAKGADKKKTAPAAKTAGKTKAAPKK